MAQNIEKAINELFADYEKSLMKAAKFAFNKAIEDIGEKATSVLDEYYDSYDPSSYDRTDSLYRCIVPYGSIQQKSNHINIQAGVEYDASVLADTYYGSNNYKPVDSDWVITNYLKGIHPITDGTRIPSDTQPADYYFEIYDPISPEQKMSTYLNEYVKDDFYTNVLLGFAKDVY